MRRTRLFSTAQCFHHENPLGLPRKGVIQRMQRGLPQQQKIKDVSKVIAVSSAKGGVGKSTIAGLHHIIAIFYTCQKLKPYLVNLALAYARHGLRSGLLDTDIFGPSIPTLMNLSGEPRLSTNNLLIPLSNYGVKSMSMGYLVGESSPVVWRGLLVMKALQQLLHEVDWGGLDVLILDLPPGTGDTQLTITQQIVLDGAIIVSTPQDIAIKDAVKGFNMFKITKTPILGMIQNMALYECPHCQASSHIFGEKNGVIDMCNEHNVKFLGDIPLHARICDDADRGMPTVVAEPTSNRAKIFVQIAENVGREVGLF
ncbi:Iron-sulfur protein IND1 [Golovinomyces cichoracearum]|uniref:Iron-sulfur protein IND1 n=1 Tax=Golovinomyces cichoracearum TaxID=62708 RepID=A0A420J5P3_9PEZI|nr:Iron-sulfur protein IND1 [Golovinomyces cichoracearum]